MDFMFFSRFYHDLHDMFLWFLWVQLAGSLGLQTAGVFRNPGPKICSEVTISTAPVAIGNLPFIDKFPSHKPAINLQVQGFSPSYGWFSQPSTIMNLQVRGIFQPCLMRIHPGSLTGCSSCSATGSTFCLPVPSQNMQLCLLTLDCPRGGFHS